MTPDNAVMVDVNLMVEALSEQRNKAMHECAVAAARLGMCQKQALALAAKVSELEARLADVKGLEKHLEELKKAEAKSEPKKKETTNARAH